MAGPGFGPGPEYNEEFAARADATGTPPASATATATIAFRMPAILRTRTQGCAGSPDAARMRPMSSTLHGPAVAAVLGRVRAQADSDDAPAKVRVAARERELGRKIYGRERADAYA